MGDRCYSTVVCAERDKDVFEKMGYTLDDSKPLAVDGKEIPGAVVMVDEQANYGNRDELTALKDVPFWACSDSCPGAFGAELIVSDGNECRCSEALHESGYPAVRVECDGTVRAAEIDAARAYWIVYAAALAAIKRTKLKKPNARSA
jgi:hypothetical protein